MCGLGYMHQEWGHGHFKGKTRRTYDTYNLDEDPHDPPFLHSIYKRYSLITKRENL